MPSNNRERRNAINNAYYHRNKERLREVQKERSAKEYKKDPNKKLEYQRQWRKDNPTKSLYYSAKRNSVENGIPFEIELSDIVIPEFCPILGIKLDRSKENWPANPSIDKIIPSLGYIKGNVHVISLRANRIKFDSTIEELKLIVNYLEKLL